VTRRCSLGSTIICFEALRSQAIDLYPEYSGTLEKEILKIPNRASYQELREVLKERYNMDLLPSFGFQNTYALALKRQVAEAHKLATISDLAKVRGLRFGFSHEFLDRQDGWRGLARAYGIAADPSGIAHGLAYEAIDQGKLDVTDVYSTDGDIQRFGLVLLKDDKHYFPEYLAAPLVRRELPARVTETLAELGNALSEEEMQKLNAMRVVGGAEFVDIARSFLQERQLLHGAGRESSRARWLDLMGYTVTHLKLTIIALLAAVAVAIPLGVVVYRLGVRGKPIIYLAGVLQTIPSMALLVFMIPLFNSIGAKPAIAALFLYALLPIVRNTAAALFSIDPLLKRVSVGMGLSAWQRLRYIELPLAVPTILAGIKTAAVITIGTATLATLIGAGGLGEPIVTGLEAKNYTLVLQGAAAAALLAVVTELGFESLERFLIPKHLLQAPAA